MTKINLNIEIGNDFASIEKYASDLAELRLIDFIDDSTEKLPFRKKDLKIKRLSYGQIRKLQEVLGAYTAAYEESSND